jgi:hypothetical protein
VRRRRTLLQTGHSEVWFPAQIRYFSFFKNLQIGPGTHPACRHVFARRESGQGMDLTVHLHQVSKFRISGAISLLSLYALMAWAAKTLNFTFEERQNYSCVRYTTTPCMEEENAEPNIFISAKKNKIQGPTMIDYKMLQ